MAEIPVQKKSSMAWLWIVLAVILLALLIWWATAGDDGEAPLDEPATAERQVDAETDLARAGAGSLSAILANPDQYVGTEYSGEVTVGDTLTDRGFWIEDNGNRLFSLIIDQPREVPKDINAGQRLQISGGKIHDSASLTDIEGADLDANTHQIIADQDVIMVVDETNIEILQRP